MSKSERGFYLFFDWLERLKELSATDAIEVIYAIANYHKSGIDPTEQFEGALKIVVALMFDQIKRGEQKSEIYRQNGSKRWENCNAIAMQSDTNNSIEMQLHVTNNNITNNNITKKEEIHKEEKNPLAERFARFWKVYPKKVGKGIAEKVFLKLKPSEALTQRMISAIEQQKHSEQWSRDNGQYIPNPSTWLNQGRWEDELTVQPDVAARTTGSGYIDDGCELDRLLDSLEEKERNGN